METKQIEVTGGMGREKNPFQRCDESLTTHSKDCQCEEWYKFKPIELPALTSEGKVPADGSYDAYLIPQFKSWNGNWYNCDHVMTKEYCQELGWPTREIWLVDDVVKLQGEQKEADITSIDKSRDDEYEFIDNASNKFIDSLKPCLHKTKGNLYHRGQMKDCFRAAIQMIDDYRSALNQ